MSNGRLTFNLQSSEQMEEFRKLLGGKYVRRTKTNDRRVAANEEYPSGGSDMREASGDVE